MMEKKRAQNIILFLKDGRKIVASVPEFHKSGDVVEVCDIQITEPYDLPDDTTWVES